MQRGSYNTRRAREGGQAMIIIAGLILLIMVLTFLLVNASILNTSKEKLLTYASEIARAGVAQATDLNNAVADGRAHLQYALAVKKATDFFDALNLGSTYTMTIIPSLPDTLTVQLQHTEKLYLIGLVWPSDTFTVVVQSTARPQVGI